jgi:hypothetical protein
MVYTHLLTNAFRGAHQNVERNLWRRITIVIIIVIVPTIGIVFYRL